MPSIILVRLAHVAVGVDEIAIVRELVFGPKRFTDLRDGLAGASPNVLSQRLRELEAGGVVRRRKAGGPT
jgi:DNA-binding HxlR family transcriptional regulator